MVRKTAVLAVLAGLGALLFGCAAPTDSTTGTAPVASAPATEAPAASATPVAVETTEPPAESNDTSRIGGAWVTYESGMAVKVTRAKVYSPSDGAIGAKAGERGVAVTVSIRNGTTAPFDATLASVKLSYGEDGIEAEQIYDSGKGYGGGFEGSIARGKTKTVSIAFAVPTKFLKSLTIEVAPNWDSDSAFFAGGAGTR